MSRKEIEKQYSPQKLKVDLWAGELTKDALKREAHKIYIREQMIKKFHSVSGCARAIGGIEKHDLFNFLAERYNKVSKLRKKLIREFFVEQGWMRKRQSARCEVQTTTRMGCCF